MQLSEFFKYVATRHSFFFQFFRSIFHSYVMCMFNLQRTAHFVIITCSNYSLISIVISQKSTEWVINLHYWWWLLVCSLRYKFLSSIITIRISPRISFSYILHLPCWINKLSYSISSRTLCEYLLYSTAASIFYEHLRRRNLSSMVKIWIRFKDIPQFTIYQVVIIFIHYLHPRRLFITPLIVCNILHNDGSGRRIWILLHNSKSVYKGHDGIFFISIHIINV